VGADSRNRCLLSPFGTKTGRNAPSTTKFAYGLPAWLRGLIKPAPGTSLAYVDWAQQEFGIAAALSGDKAMQEAYLSGDPYLMFAKQAGAVPEDATRLSHATERGAFKIASLAVQYGMTEWSLAPQIGKTPAHARELLNLHRKAYPRFWQWDDSAVDYAMLHGKLHTVFGWNVHVGCEPNVRSLGNFLMQANGAEMLRLACCTMTEAGISVCAPVHDAVLVEAETACIADVVKETQQHMLDASKVVLSGFELRSDVEIIDYPVRYRDTRGIEMWQKVMKILDEIDETETANVPGTCGVAPHSPVAPRNTRNSLIY
jgi:DNA polymerase I